MDNRNRSRSFGTILAPIAAIVAAFTVNSALAESVATINGVDIEQSTFNQYLESTFFRNKAAIDDFLDFILVFGRRRGIRNGQVKGDIFHPLVLFFLG